MSFDPRPVSTEEEKMRSLAHSQTMLNLISALGSFSADPLPKFNYGNKSQAVNQEISSNFLNSILSANVPTTPTSGRQGALRRRLMQ